MRQLTKEVKAKGQVVGSITINIPENYLEAEATYGAEGLSAMEYGLVVKAMNAERQGATAIPSAKKQLLKALELMKQQVPDAYEALCAKYNIQR